jgi:hypothetical protein
MGVAVMVVSALMTVVGCTRTVGGTAQRVIDHAASQRGYGYTEDRCGLLEDASIQEIIGADKLVRPYSGAVCQYILTRKTTTIDLTYSWFETGTLDRERALAASKNSQLTDVEVVRHQAFIARRPVTGNACSATAATNPGVASWWVQIRGDAPFDPCEEAQTLLSKTLSSDM